MSKQSALNIILSNKLKLNFAIFPLILALLLFSLPLKAQQHDISAKDILANVNGEVISETDISFAAEDLGQELANIPPAQQKAFLLSVLIDMKILAQAARDANLQNSDSYKRRLSYLEDRALRRAYFTDKIGPQIKQKDIKKYYDELVAKFEPKEEYRVRHILVASEEDAKIIAQQIKDGKPFEIAAFEHSTDSTANNGGDLGYLQKEQMVEPFKEALLKLEIGQMSEPVKTRFGWHLIRLEDKRMSSPPPLEQLSGQIQQQLLIKAFNEEISKLKDKAKIEILDENLANLINSQGNTEKGQ